MEGTESGSAQWREEEENKRVFQKKSGEENTREKRHGKRGGGIERQSSKRGNFSIDQSWLDAIAVGKKTRGGDKTKKKPSRLPQP